MWKQILFYKDIKIGMLIGSARAEQISDYGPEDARFVQNTFPVQILNRKTNETSIYKEEMFDQSISMNIFLYFWEVQEKKLIPEKKKEKKSRLDFE